MSGIDTNAIKVADSLMKMSTDKLKMLGISVHHFENSNTRIVRLEAKGIVDEDFDWNPESSRTQHTHRIQGLREGTPNKEKLESTNFEMFIQHPFGIVELIRREPRIYFAFKGSDGGKNAEYKPVLLDRCGNVIYDGVTSNKHNKGYDFENSKDYEEKIGSIRGRLIDEIIKYNLTREEAQQYNEQHYRAETRLHYEITEIMFMSFNALEHSTLMFFESDCVYDGMVLYSPDGKIIDYGKDTVHIISEYIKEDLLIDDSLIDRLKDIGILVFENSIVLRDVNTGLFISKPNKSDKATHIYSGSTDRLGLIANELIEEMLNELEVLIRQHR